MIDASHDRQTSVDDRSGQPIERFLRRMGTGDGDEPCCGCRFGRVRNHRVSEFVRARL
jgi:hypothetical protein